MPLKSALMKKALPAEHVLESRRPRCQDEPDHNDDRDGDDKCGVPSDPATKRIAARRPLDSAVIAKSVATSTLRRHRKLPEQRRFGMFSSLIFARLLAHDPGDGSILRGREFPHARKRNG